MRKLLLLLFLLISLLLLQPKQIGLFLLPTNFPFVLLLLLPSLLLFKWITTPKLNKLEEIRKCRAKVEKIFEKLRREGLTHRDGEYIHFENLIESLRYAEKVLEKDPKDKKFAKALVKIALKEAKALNFSKYEDEINYKKLKKLNGIF